MQKNKKYIGLLTFKDAQGWKSGGGGGVLQIFFQNIKQGGEVSMPNV